MRKSNKRAARRPGIKCAPMLVMRGMVNDRIEMRERMDVESFACGWATSDQFDMITDMSGVTILGACISESRLHISKYCKEIVVPVLASIRVRHEQSGAFSAPEHEMEVLRKFVTIYRDFWIRQPHALYETACQQLNKHYEMMKSQDKPQLEAA